jgi:nicotinate dehydrogenase subunit B
MRNNIYGADLSRRGFLKAGGALVVGFGLLKQDAAEGAVSKTTLDPALPQSWLEIHADNTVTIRTGKCDFGQGSVYTAYRQIIADELDMPIEAVKTVVVGDTDVTPDGGGTFDLLGRGVINLRKAAAYTRHAMLELASQRLGVAKDQLSTDSGFVSGGGKRMSYGEIVKDQDLKLTIPVTGELTSMFGLVVSGDPEFRPVSSYKYVGKSFQNSIITSKVTAQETWITDVKLPGMLHARMVRPATLGSKLISAGQVDKKRFPNAQVVVKGNLVGVLAPTEWEAIQAARQVAGDTKWTEWKGLPGSANVARYFRQDADWKTAKVSRSPKSKGDVASTMQSAGKKHSATYDLPYMKHAPIAPPVAVADARADGTIVVHTHSQNPQALRGQIALMLGLSEEKVVVKEHSGAGHYGRSNGGNAGAEDDAVILSKEVGHPVRVQWTRPEDFQWSTQSSGGYADVKIALDASGKISAYEVDHYMPAMQDDRPIGAVLAGLPTMDAPHPQSTRLNSTVNGNADPWVYDGAANLEERAHGTWQVGQRESPIAVGLRDHSMRTPGQFQQNFPREVAISEAAALAGADPIQFRIDHVKEERLKQVLERVRAESGWQTRTSPNPKASAKGTAQVRGQGVSVMLRKDCYWACTAQVLVTPETGAVSVEKITMVVDPGIVVNPMQLKRQVEGGSLMGVSHALYEELAFDESGITSKDWLSYPILKMGDMPEVKVVLIHRPQVGNYGQGSETANALAAPAIAAAFFDATGKPARRIPLRPAYVKGLLKT